MAETIVIDRDIPANTAILIKPQKWYINILVRAGRTFLQSFVALGSILFAATLVVDVANYDQWLQTAFIISFGKKVLVCFVVALVTALWAVAQNLLEILTRLDETNPQMRG